MPRALARTSLMFIAALFVGTTVTSGVRQMVAHADSDDGEIGSENIDVAIPGPVPADTRPTRRGAVTAQATAEPSDDITVLAAPAGLAIEDFHYDELVLEGRAADVCAGQLLQGTSWAFYEIVGKFGGTAGSMYTCRERWDAANDPDCNGTVVNPVTNPNFTSTCWSNHARGRAFDVMVGGSAAAGYNRTRGLAIVNWLLATDANGNVNSVARRLGVQQLLFDDRCWNSEGDRGISSWNAMRTCGIGHHDHVHVDMTVRGAAGQVSYWGNPMEPPAPKFDTQVFYDFNAAWRQALSWWNMRATDEEGVAIAAGYTRSLTGDWDSNGEQGETFLWNPNNGYYYVQDWSDGDSLNARMGRLQASNVVGGDLDGDGEFDDMLFYSFATGAWRVWSWDNFEPRLRAGGTWNPGIDRFTVGDFDGDGLDNDMHVWDAETGGWNVFTFVDWNPVYRRRGSFSVRYDQLIVGDFNAGGRRDETLLWDRHYGTWILYDWKNFYPRFVNQGTWSSQFDIVAPGDYDTDGREDDVFLYDVNTGRWYVISFHRYVPTTRTSGTWLAGYDAISVGPFNE